MKFLIIAALVAVASADYHDDTFHFSTLGGVSGFQKSSFLPQAASPVLAKKFTAFAAPAISKHHFAAVHQAPVYTAAPLLVKSVPVFSQQYSASSSSASAPHFRILSQVQESDPAGPYKLSYSTENGIQVNEQGALVSSAEGGVVAAQGSYSFTAPDGQAYTVNYIADENGFRAAGDHLPTPPPIPAEILKSLEENASSSEQYDDQGRLLKK